MEHRLIAEEICARLTDREIVAKSLEDLDFFSCLYIRYGPRLLHHIKRISSLDDQEARDILQESMIKAWRNLNAFQPDLKLSSWLYRIVHNETISYWRKSRTSGKHSIVGLRRGKLENIADDPDETTRRTERGEAIDRILGQLPLKYREVLILKFMENMHYDEISDILRIPEGTVATRINRAKKAFMKIAGTQFPEVG